VPTVADTCGVRGAVPLLGEIESQLESLVAVKFRVPMPVLVIVNGAGGGSEPPATAVNMRLEGDTDNTGWLAAALEPYAETGELLHAAPVDHVNGKAVRFPSLLVSDRRPEEPVSRITSVPEPDGPRIAIQYAVPAVTVAFATGTVFQVDATGDERVP
jgi:hypothetical protein